MPTKLPPRPYSKLEFRWELAESRFSQARPASGRIGRVKLLRVGPVGSERPAVLAADGRLHDVSGQPNPLIDRSAIDVAGLPPILDSSPRIGAPLATGQDRLHRPELPRPRRRDRRPDPGRADRLHEGAGHGGRPRRPGARAARQREDRLGGRARRRRSAAPPATCPLWTRPATAIGGYVLVARRERARVPARTRRAVGQGQELRDVQPARPVGGDRRRGARSAVAGPAPVGQRRAASRTAPPRT